MSSLIERNSARAAGWLLLSPMATSLSCTSAGMSALVSTPRMTSVVNVLLTMALSASIRASVAERSPSFTSPAIVSSC